MGGGPEPIGGGAEPIGGATDARADRRVDLAVLVLGFGALATATAAGWSPRLLGLIVAPPAVLRYSLAGAALLLGFVLLGRAVDRLATASGPRDTIRGVRFAFLALGAAAAAGGWLVGSALPIVVAGVIAGVDVVETTFLLLALGIGRARSRRAGDD